jgi:hypothetical protein
MEVLKLTLYDKEKWCTSMYTTSVTIMDSAEGEKKAPSIREKIWYIYTQVHNYTKEIDSFVIF